MVINETDTYTNTTGAPLVVSLYRFQFYATRVTATALTPFVVRVNGDNNFTVLAVGTTRTSYVVGVNDVPFSNAATQLTLAAGETIAMGFLDAFPDGSGGAADGVIAYNANTGADQIHYSGGTASTNSGRVTVGQPPVFGTTIYTTFGRNYFYSITFVLGDGGISDGDLDDDGLPDNWELAFTTNLAAPSATSDFDQDGISDADERLAGTDPVDKASRFQIRELRPVAGTPGIRATFDSVPGRSYRILVSPDLATWEDMGTVRAADWPAATTTFQIRSADLPGGTAQRVFMKATTLRGAP